MDKAPDAYRTISEVGEDLDIAQHVLRFWETRFPQIKPLKRGGGRRYYRPDDVELLKGIRHLLYKEGYTIKGVQRILKEQGLRAVQAFARPPEPETWQEPEGVALELMRKPDPVIASRSARPETRMPPRLEPVPHQDEDAGTLFASTELPTMPPVLMPPAHAAPSGFAEPSPSGQVSMFRGGVHSAPVLAQPAITQAAGDMQAPVAGASAQEMLVHALHELEACRQIIGATLARQAG